ncbi:hypothetical protein [Treponema sp.]|uniref:hypothetical protein n=1 Tax=Treponema sp. TaxID=166 RepID=UPI00388CF55D
MLFDNFLAQILVVLMLFFCSIRIFFIKHSRIDCFVAFSPMALVVSILNLVCFEFTTLNFAVFALSLMVFFTNFRAILRLSAKLIVDTYNALFIVFTIVGLILTVILTVIIIIFRPVKYSEHDFNIIRKEFALAGNTSNLHIKENVFTGEAGSGNLFLYEPVVIDEIVAELYQDNPVLIFAGSARGNVLNYEPYFMLLAQKGYKVIAADLFTKDLKLFSDFTENKAVKNLLDSKKFRRFAATQIFERYYTTKIEEILKNEQALASKKYSALTKLTLELLGDDTKLFYIVDGVDFDSIYSVIDEFNTEPYSNAKGFFSMNRVDEYKTSGYGFIEQTDIFLAHQKGIERENKFFIARYVANKTIKAIQEQK